jgi:hypothetical protein
MRTSAPRLPGADLVETGLADLARGVRSVEALLVQIGAPRLRQLGIAVPESQARFPETQLYALLAEHAPDSAHSRYNALIRRLVSYERAAAYGRKPTPAASPQLTPTSFRHTLLKPLGENR